jgi:DNA (cytosine-5)-methyltransferase 1
MKVGSLFSGIGGLDLGLERAGMEVVWQVEKDPYCNKVLAKHWQKVPRYGDIKEIDFTTLPAVDLICGGFPCQPVSCAGKRRGDKDERWLWPEFYRAICEACPRWALVENVPGLLSASDGRLFGGILGDLARGGYDAEWDLLPAAAFGAPHLRFRLFLVAHARSCSGVGGALEPGREEERGTTFGGHGKAMADAELRGWDEGSKPAERQTGIEIDRLRRCGGAENVAYPEGQPLGAGFCPDEPGGKRRGRFGDSHRTGDATNPGIEGLSEPEQEAIFRKRRGQQGGAVAKCDWWIIEPDVGRVAHGVSKRVDRLKCLGNAVVPQVVEWIGRRIMQNDY